MQSPPQSPPGSSQGSKVVIIVAVVAGALVVVVGIVGILAALAISGMRKYLANAKEAEGRAAVAAIARGVIACSNRETVVSGPGGALALPPSTPAVPATLDAITGRKYQSAPSEWSVPPWDCIGFQMSTPQYFQYQWVRTGDTEGTARAVADLDGDGAVDVTFALPVTCVRSPWACSAGTVQETR